MEDKTKTMCLGGLDPSGGGELEKEVEKDPDRVGNDPQLDTSGNGRGQTESAASPPGNGLPEGKGIPGTSAVVKSDQEGEKDSRDKRDKNSGGEDKLNLNQKGGVGVEAQPPEELGVNSHSSFSASSVPSKRSWRESGFRPSGFMPQRPPSNGGMAFSVSEDGVNMGRDNWREMRRRESAAPPSPAMSPMSSCSSSSSVAAFPRGLNAKEESMNRPMSGLMPTETWMDQAFGKNRLDTFAVIPPEMVEIPFSVILFSDRTSWENAPRQEELDEFVKVVQGRSFQWSEVKWFMIPFPDPKSKERKPLADAAASLVDAARLRCLPPTINILTAKVINLLLQKDPNYLLYCARPTDGLPRDTWFAIPILPDEEPFAIDASTFPPNLFAVDAIGKGDRFASYEDDARQFIDDVLAEAPLRVTRPELGFSHWASVSESYIKSAKESETRLSSQPRKRMKYESGEAQTSSPSAAVPVPEKASPSSMAASAAEVRAALESLGFILPPPPPASSLPFQEGGQVSASPHLPPRLESPHSNFPLNNYTPSSSLSQIFKVLPPSPESGTVGEKGQGPTSTGNTTSGGSLLIPSRKVEEERVMEKEKGSEGIAPTGNLPQSSSQSKDPFRLQAGPQEGRQYPQIPLEDQIKLLELLKQFPPEAIRLLPPYLLHLSPNPERQPPPPQRDMGEFRRKQKEEGRGREAYQGPAGRGTVTHDARGLPLERAPGSGVVLTHVPDRHLITATDILEGRRLDAAGKKKDILGTGRKKTTTAGQAGEKEEEDQGGEEDKDGDPMGGGSSRTKDGPGTPNRIGDLPEAAAQEIMAMRLFLTEYAQPLSHLTGTRERMMEEMAEEGPPPTIVATVLQEPKMEEGGMESRRNAIPHSYDTRATHHASARTVPLRESTMPAVQMNVMMDLLIHHPPDSFNPSLFVLLPQGEDAIEAREPGMQCRWPLVMESIVPLDDSEEEKKRCQHLRMLKKLTNRFAAIFQANLVPDGLMVGRYALDGYMMALNAFAEGEAERQSLRWGPAMLRERERVKQTSSSSSSSINYKLAKKQKAEEAFFSSQALQQRAMPLGAMTAQSSAPSSPGNGPPQPYTFFPAPTQTLTQTFAQPQSAGLPMAPSPPAYFPSPYPTPPASQPQYLQQQYDPSRGWQLVGIPANAGGIQGNGGQFSRRRFPRAAGGWKKENFQNGGAAFRGGGRARGRGNFARGGRGGASSPPLPVKEESTQ